MFDYDVIYRYVIISPSNKTVISSQSEIDRMRQRGGERGKIETKESEKGERGRDIERRGEREILQISLSNTDA